MKCPECGNLLDYIKDCDQGRGSLYGCSDCNAVFMKSSDDEESLQRIDSSYSEYKSPKPEDTPNGEATVLVPDGYSGKKKDGVIKFSFDDNNTRLTLRAEAFMPPDILKQLKDKGVISDPSEWQYDSKRSRDCDDADGGFEDEVMSGVGDISSYIRRINHR